MAVRKLKQCEAGDGSYGGAVLAAFDMQAIVNDFARGQRLAIQLSRQGGSVQDELLPHERETLERDYARSIYDSCDREDAEAEREAAMCRYCGQDHCVCEKRYGSVQGIVSRREAGRKA